MSDIANLQIRVDSSGVVTATNSLKGLEEQGGRTQGSMDAQEKQSHSLTDSFLAYATALGAAYFSFQAITQAIESSLSDYKEAGQNTAVLAGALKASGDNSEESLQAMKDMGSEIQSMTGYSADASSKTEGLLISIGHLDSGGVQQILPHVADLAQGLGINLSSAAEMVAKSLDGSRNMLSRYGIEVDKSADSSQRLDEITKGLQDKFGGIATTVGEDAVGSMLKLENANKELSAQLGENFARSAQPIMDFLTKLKLSWADELKAENDYLASHQKVLAGMASGQDIINENTFTLKKLQEQLDIIKGSASANVDQTGKLSQAYSDNIKFITDQMVALEKQNLQLSNASVYQKQHVDAINKTIKASEDAEAADKKWRDSVLTSLSEISGAEARTGKEDSDAKAKAYAKESADATAAAIEYLAMLDKQTKAEQADEKLKQIAVQNAEAAKKQARDDATQAAIDADKQQIESFQSVFEELGTATEAGTLSWKSFADAGLHAIGMVIHSIGDQLAAQAAADLVRAAALSATVFGAPEAAGYYAAGGIEIAGAGVAWAAGAALEGIKLARGGDFTVPPGYPNDSFRTNLTSGEHVHVDPVGAPASGADRPIHYTFMLDGQVFADWIERSSRNKRFIMHKGVITN